MAQKFHKVRGQKLEQAYQEMRRRFGDEAIVISTQQITEGGLLGFFGQRLVEITASVPAPALVDRARKMTAVERKYAAQSEPPRTDTEYF